MSLLGAYNDGISGLLAFSEAMGSVSTNIANTRTVGYKQADTEFATLLAGDQINAVNGEDTGGVQAWTRNLVELQGPIEASTGRPAAASWSRAVAMSATRAPATSSPSSRRTILSRPTSPAPTAATCWRGPPTTKAISRSAMPPPLSRWSPTRRPTFPAARHPTPRSPL